LFIRNKLHGEGYGVELAADWQPFDWWRVSGVYAFLQLNMRRDKDSLDTSTADSLEGSAPAHQVSLRSFMRLPGQVEFDLVWRYVDSLPSQEIDSYHSLEARLGWRPLPHLTVAVVGQNLLTDHHAEFGGGSSGIITEIERSVYGKVIWHW
jgi:iron complex outermembrane receptor protein